MKSADEAYDEICYYTLSRGDAEFIHQHVVDAFAAQNATIKDKPIRLAFALVGLYLHVEKGFTGREVQRAHMKLAQKRRDWPRFRLPPERGEITSVEVEQAPAGIDRDQMIRAWCGSVWKNFTSARSTIEKLLIEAGSLN
ncbi:MAG: DUF5946 family protein [Pyrinomonadaceae bacterium]